MDNFIKRKTVLFILVLLVSVCFSGCQKAKLDGTWEWVHGDEEVTKILIFDGDNFKNQSFENNKFIYEYEYIIKYIKKEKNSGEFHAIHKEFYKSDSDFSNPFKYQEYSYVIEKDKLILTWIFYETLVKTQESVLEYKRKL